jgi:hypothetical protein
MASPLVKLPMLQPPIDLTRWKIAAAVFGYACTQAGKTFTVEMDSGKRV